MELTKESEKSFSEGAEKVSSGDNTENAEKNDSQKDYVSYETHKRILAQRKKDQEKLKEYEDQFKSIADAKAQAEEKRLLDKGEFEKIVKLREQKINELSQSLESVQQEKNEYQKNIIDAYKLQAFNEELSGKISKREYLSFVPLDKIAYNPETGEIDKQSVALAANEFAENHPNLIESNKTVRLPNGYPTGPNKLTHAQWKELPLKEMKKRIKDIIHTN